MSKRALEKQRTIDTRTKKKNYLPFEGTEANQCAGKSVWIRWKVFVHLGEGKLKPDMLDLWYWYPAETMRMHEMTAE